MGTGAGFLRRLSRRAGKLRLIAARYLLSLAPGLVVLFRCVSSLSIATRVAQPACRLHEAHSRRVSLDASEAIAFGIIRRGRRKAANRLAALVRDGYSTTISPDGPYGPAVLKKGVLHVALQSGVRIVPLTISSSRFISWPSWDSKKFPLLFGKGQGGCTDAIRVNRHNFDEAGARIIHALGGCEDSA
jgi:hypothetical protein